MKAIQSIRKKIKELGGVEFSDKKTDQKIRDQVLKKMNPGELLVDFIDNYGFGSFKKNIGFKTIEKIPVTGKNGLSEVGFIFGWSNDESGVKWHLEQLEEDTIANYFPFAEGYPGDCLCISTKMNTDKGKIYYWSHDDGELYLVSNSFEEFIKSWEVISEEQVDLSGLIGFSLDDDL